MKFILLFLGMFLILSCEQKDLAEIDIQNILDSSKDYHSYTLKKDFNIDFPKDKNENIINNSIIKKEDFRPYYKVDFNNDGYPDYLLNLVMKPKADSILFPIDEYKNFVILLSKKNKGFKLINVDDQRVYFDIVGTKPKGKNEFLLLNIKRKILFENKNNIFDKVILKIKNETLTETSKNKNYIIEKISVKDIGGWSGENYLLNITKDSIILQSRNYKKLKGRYFTIDKEAFGRFSNYLNEHGFSDLQNKYSLGCSDCDAMELTIFYEQNNKYIYDYGARGTLGLSRFYELIDEYIDKAEWQKIE